MAVDTKAKRYAIFGIGKPWLQFTLPDASKGSLWRGSLLGAYGGNAFAAPSEPAEPFKIQQTRNIVQRYYVAKEY